ncbi:hypothetical protein ZEAMMB73_Zm00001d019289 [Zea mays]|uniref:Uncharacterized protein n=1 Tax=Zea mays TaxID=4577 RepID=A0A1D6HWN3_MAIZE|nr:hypothetical protein ZEAMMB73_Zm00001d019289 [Zea mays]
MPRHLVGDSVGNLSLKELKQLESRLEKDISKIRARKSELLAAEINYMAKRETELQNDHMNLRTKSQANVWLTSTCRTQEHALQATDQKINLQDTKNMPYRPLKCQSCCPGFFCPDH